MNSKAITALLSIAALAACGTDLDSPLADMQVSGWEMMQGDADRTEILSFRANGVLTLDVAGTVTRGSWSLDGDGAHCMALPDLAESCFEPRINGTRVSIVLNDEIGQPMRMWSGELSPMP